MAERADKSEPWVKPMAERADKSEPWVKPMAERAGKSEPWVKPMAERAGKSEPWCNQNTALGLHTAGSSTGTGTGQCAYALYMAINYISGLGLTVLTQ